MMFSSDDLGYIESEMLNVISDRAVNPRQSFELSNIRQFDTVDMTPADFSDLLKVIEPQWITMVRKLENSWKIEPREHPQEN